MRYYLAVAAALALQASAAQAETVVALIGSDVIATFDTRTSKTTSWTKIDGIGPVLGIDFRPADGQLYALTSDGIIATVDPTTGEATPKATLEAVLPEGVKISVDFNPVADKMRILGSDGTNLRVNVNDGAVVTDKQLAFAENDVASGDTPMIVAGAYTNAVKGPKETTLYDIDGTLGRLLRQVPPNDGILNSVGSIGVDAEGVAFDISTDSAGTNSAMLLAGGSLYSVDLTTGAALSGKPIAKLPSGVLDIAIMPAKAPNQTAAADVTQTDGIRTSAKADTTAGYLPKPMPQAKAKTQMKASIDKPRYRKEMRRSAYSAPRKPKHGSVQCDRDDDY
jgi:hypothetical protein